MKFKVTHEFNVAADKLWAAIFDPEFIPEMMKVAKLDQYDMKVTDTGTHIERKIRVLPNIPIPAFAKKVIGDGGLGYLEENRAPKTGPMSYTWKVMPDSLADKLSFSGTFTVEPLGANRARRIIDGDITIKIFGVGGMLEKFMVGELEKMYDGIAKAQERWVQSRSK